MHRQASVTKGHPCSHASWLRCRHRAWAWARRVHRCPLVFQRTASVWNQQWNLPNHNYSINVKSETRATVYNQGTPLHAPRVNTVSVRGLALRSPVSYYWEYIFRCCFSARPTSLIRTYQYEFRIGPPFCAKTVRGMRKNKQITWFLAMNPWTDF